MNDTNWWLAGFIILPDLYFQLHVLLDELMYRLECPMDFQPTPIDPLNPQPPPGLTPESECLFCTLPKTVRLSLLTRKDKEGRPALPPISSEILVAHLVEKELKRRSVIGSGYPLTADVLQISRRKQVASRTSDSSCRPFIP